MYQVAFAPEEFRRLVPWLMLNRGGLDVLVHPQTDDAYADHTEHACWLGATLPLRLEVLRRGRGRLNRPAACAQSALYSPSSSSTIRITSIRPTPPLG